MHWGLNTGTDVNRKSGVVAQIGNLAPAGSFTPSRYVGAIGRTRVVWLDGAPVASATTRAGLYVNGLGQGFQITVPAGPSVRTLDVYLGGYKTLGRVEAFLSDGSAPGFATTVGDVSTGFDRRVSLSFQAATPGQVLTFRYVNERNSGNVALQGATLSTGL